MSDKIKIISWSHCSGEWMFFGYFKSKKEAYEYIAKKGYDPKYFKEDKW